MKTAEEILNKNTGHAYGLIMDAMVIQSMKEFALEVAKEALKNASINVSMKMKENVYELDMMDDILEVDRASILNENNIPKL